MERGIGGRCGAPSGDGHVWRCRVGEGRDPVTVTIDGRGAWQGSRDVPNGPPHTVTVDVDGRAEVATIGEFSSGETLFGCCVPLP